MVACQNCGKFNAFESHFCRFCGTKMTAQQPAVQSPNPYDYGAPRPYAWKTDEFQQQQPQSRPTDQIDRVQQLDQTNRSSYQPAPLAYAQPQQFAQGFRCPNCMSQYLPRLEKRISTAGWITFAVLLVFFFPLFWIGLLIKEDVHVCVSCNSKLNANYR